MSQGNSARIYLGEDRSGSYCKKEPGVRLGLGAPAATSESSSPASGTVNLGGEVANWPAPVHPWLFFGGG